MLKTMNVSIFLKQTGFVSDTNRVTLLIPGKKPEKWPLMDKSKVACKLLEKVAAML